MFCLQFLWVENSGRIHLSDLSVIYIVAAGTGRSTSKNSFFIHMSSTQGLSLALPLLSFSPFLFPHSVSSWISLCGLGSLQYGGQRGVTLITWWLASKCEWKLPVSYHQSPKETGNFSLYEQSRSPPSLKEMLHGHPHSQWRSAKAYMAIFNLPQGLWYNIAWLG